MLLNRGGTELMMMILKGALFFIPIIFLVFFGRAEATLAPGAAAAGALLVWWLDTEEPPRITAYAVTLLGAVVAFTKEAPLWWLATIIAFGCLYAVDTIARRQRRDDPSGGTVLAAAVAAALLTLGCQYAGARATPIGVGTPQRIVVIGDSLTSGFPGDGVSVRWAQILARDLNASLVDLSFPGDTLQSSRQRWDNRIGPRRWNPEEPAWQPDLVIVLLGGNNILRREGRGSVDAGLRQWAEDLKQANANVLLIGVPGAPFRDPYAGAWERAAQEAGFAYMNEDALRRVFLSSSMTLPGRIHLNAAGHEYFALQVKRRIEGI